MTTDALKKSRYIAACRTDLKHRLAWYWLLHNKPDITERITTTVYKKYPTTGRRALQSLDKTLELLKEIDNG
jgi:hypothetical protein